MENNLEYLFKNNLIDEVDINTIDLNRNFFELVKKYNRFDILHKIKGYTFLKPSGNQLLIDDYIDAGIKIPLSSFALHPLPEHIIKREEYYLLENIDAFRLGYKLQDDSNKTYFEFLLEKGVVCKQINSLLKDVNNISREYVKIIVKNDRLDILVDANEALLADYFGDKTIYEMMLDKGFKPNIKNYTKQEIISFLVSKEDYEELSKCTESAMEVYQKQTGYSILIELIKRDFPVNIEKIDNLKAIKYILENDKKQYYEKLDLRVLLSLADLNKTYLDILLEKKKEDNSIKLPNIQEETYNDYEIAKICIVYAQNDLQNELPLTKEFLLKKNRNSKTLLDYLMEYDSKITIEKLLTDELKEDEFIQMLISVQETKKLVESVNTRPKIIKGKINEQKVKKYNSLKISEENKILLDTLSALLMNGYMDQELVTMLIASYRKQIAENNVSSYEIIQLINMIQNGDGFILEKSDKETCYYKERGKILMQDVGMDVLNHEFTHMLFHKLAENKVPREFESLIIKLRNDPKFIEKTAQHSGKLHTIMNQLGLIVEMFFMKDYDKRITPEYKKEIEEFLKDPRAFIRYIGKYGEIDLNISVEEFLHEERDAAKKEIQCAILSKDYYYMNLIGDILDAVHGGKYLDGRLVDKNGNNIRGTVGHGQEYYNNQSPNLKKRNIENIFDEMLANYVALLKGENSKRNLNYLRNYIGEELFNLIQNYYQTQILQSQKYMVETAKTM